MIDPHVHCRDGKQVHKETIKHVFEIAEMQGVKKIFDMPNTDPPLCTENDVHERLKLVPDERKGDYFLYIGATSDEKQLETAVNCYDKYPEVIGIKLYAGKSVGNLAVIDPEDQKRVYKKLSDLGYAGVIALHCEKESHLLTGIWTPKNPVTHSYSRPKESEIESVKDQIAFARETGFNGILHICHVSCPESVELIDRARKTLNITCGVTPHHILWSDEMLNGSGGLLYKMNPPLRDAESVEKLRLCLKEGKIDWIETDHAPHAIGEKLFAPHMSGYPSLYLYRSFVENFLPDMGISKSMIMKLTLENIEKTFKNKL